MILTLNIKKLDEHIYLRSIGKGVETYTSKTKKAPAKKAPAKKPAPVPVKPAPAKRPVVARRPEPEYEDEYDYEEEPQYEPAPRRPQPAPAPQPLPQTRPQPKVQPEEDYSSFFDDDEDTTPVAPQTTAPVHEDYQDDDESIVSGDYDLSEVLKDITNRYNNLDFTTDDNMNEKLKLIRDIETLIESENAKGEGIYSDNEDIRQIFNDLQDVVDDMKNAL